MLHLYTVLKCSLSLHGGDDDLSCDPERREPSRGEEGPWLTEVRLFCLALANNALY